MGRFHFSDCLVSVFFSLIIFPSIGFAEPNLNYRPADTSSPRSTLKDFIDASNQISKHVRDTKFVNRDSEALRPIILRILDCLDQSDLPAFAREMRAAEVAICLKEIMDRVELPPFDEIPGIEEVDSAGDKLTSWRIPGTRITIARMEEGPQKHEYLFSKGTVDRAVRYYQDMKAYPYRTSGPETSPGFYRWYFSSPGHSAVVPIIERLPKGFRDQVFGMAVWKWPALFLSIIVASLVMLLIYRIHFRLTQRWKGKNIVCYCLTIIFPILAVFAPFIVTYVVKDQLIVRGWPLYIVDFASLLIALLASIFVVFAASNRVAETIIASPKINPQGLNAQLIRIISRLMSMVIAVAVFLVGGQYLGIKLTTLLASAGIGGFAVALAAQDTLKTLFGTIMLMADKPFRVGERIQFNQYDGNVEDIGLRSTRVRLLTGNLVTIPNDELARCDIENITRRPYIRRSADIKIPLDTHRTKVEQCIEIIRNTLKDHEGMNPDLPARVYFDEFNDDSFNIKVIYWYTPPEFWDFLAFSQKVNLQIFQAFEEQGIQFSQPLRVVHTDTESQGP
ncbi:mechanosensitive ion channel family protein [Gimesia aquarii]|uniref:Low conductance mechanosensitive channel YnaI n=1 Tax=Gimesia aquarii TaxID=2527964 RepID=A0A517X1Y4_9PLAN|nr:mechanosensitive ion channel family protein [Gimesia aquarii]QDU11510.1 Low conductance mechanosensitive channel YnaI [Gimesia aquarii]